MASIARYDSNHHHHYHHHHPPTFFSYLFLFTLTWLCLFLMQLHSTRGAVNDHHHIVNQNNNFINKTSTPPFDCRQELTKTRCPSELNQSCSQTSGACTCLNPNTPILLSNEIPCLRAKLLGEVCLHSLECSMVENAACYATILFPLELQSLPSHRQWYIYSQITESGELNYLLNKVYGQCRCTSGYRAVSPQRCLPKDSLSTGQSCRSELINNTEQQLLSLGANSSSDENLLSTTCLTPHSHCDQKRQQCSCDSGFTFDEQLQTCHPLEDRHGQFCVVNADCQQKSGDPNLVCSKQFRCSCSQGFIRSPNATACPLPRDCTGLPGTSWNSATLSCESHSPVMFDSLLVKIVLLLLLKLIICNLVRIACYSKRIAATAAATDSHRGHRGSRFFESTRQVADQSRSLLSLPPYESICQQSDNSSLSLSVSASHFHCEDSPSDSLPPTYEEALHKLGADDAGASDGYKTLPASQAESNLVAISNS